MASTSDNGAIAVMDAVNQKIVREKEMHAVASVTKIGVGGYGNVYKICAKSSSSTSEESTEWENPLLVRCLTYRV